MEKMAGPNDSASYIVVVVFLLGVFSLHFSSWCFLGLNLGITLIFPLSAGYPHRLNESHF